MSRCQPRPRPAISYFCRPRTDIHARAHVSRQGSAFLVSCTHPVQTARRKFGRQAPTSWQTSSHEAAFPLVDAVFPPCSSPWLPRQDRTRVLRGSGPQGAKRNKKGDGAGPSGQGKPNGEPESDLDEGAKEMNKEETLRQQAGKRLRDLMFAMKQALVDQTSFWQSGPDAYKRPGTRSLDGKHEHGRGYRYVDDKNRIWQDVAGVGNVTFVDGEEFICRLKKHFTDMPAPVMHAVFNADVKNAAARLVERMTGGSGGKADMLRYRSRHDTWQSFTVCGILILRQDRDGNKSVALSKGNGNPLEGVPLTTTLSYHDVVKFACDSPVTRGDGMESLKVCGIDPGANTFLMSMDLDGEVMFFGQAWIGKIMHLKAMHQALCDSLNPR